MSLMFLPHFDVLCDLLLNRHTATWNPFVLNNKETNHSRFLYIFQNLSALLENRPFLYFAYKMKLRKITPLAEKAEWNCEIYKS